MTLSRIFSAALLTFATSAVFASPLTIEMKSVDPAGNGASIGTVTITAQKCGVLITPNLHDLKPGAHGFHIHESPSCADHAMAAGGHLDPKKTIKHEGPYAHGHLGDLPVLIVDKDGNATLPTLASRLSIKDFKGHAIMIHAGGDNYSDTPEKLGGGGARIACGVVPN